MSKLGSSWTASFTFVYKFDCGWPPIECLTPLGILLSVAVRYKTTHYSRLVCCIINEILNDIIHIYKNQPAESAMESDNDLYNRPVLYTFKIDGCLNDQNFTVEGRGTGDLSKETLKGK